MKINKNYGFLLSNNKYVKYLLIDGYEVGGLKLDSVPIKVALDNNNNAIAWFSEEIKQKYNLNSNDYKKELNDAAYFLKEAIENNIFSLFAFPYDDIYDQNNNKVEILNQQILGDFKYLNLTEKKIKNIPLISKVYEYKENYKPVFKMTNIERTIESLNMVNFIKDLSRLDIKISLK